MLNCHTDFHVHSHLNTCMCKTIWINEHMQWFMYISLIITLIHSWLLIKVWTLIQWHTLTDCQNILDIVMMEVLITKWPKWAIEVEILSANNPNLLLYKNYKNYLIIFFMKTTSVMLHCYFYENMTPYIHFHLGNQLKNNQIVAAAIYYYIFKSCDEIRPKDLLIRGRMPSPYDQRC